MRATAILTFWHILWVAGMAPTILSAADGSSDSDARENLVDEISPYVDERTVLITQINLAEFDYKSYVDLLEGFTPGWANPDQVDRQMRKFSEWRQAFRAAGGRNAYVVASLAEDPADAPFIIIPTSDVEDPQRIVELLAEYTELEDRAPERGRLPFELTARLDDAVFLGSRPALNRIKHLKAVDRPELAHALRSVGDADVRVAFLATDETRRAFRAIDPTTATLPECTGEILTDGIVWAALGMQTPPELRIDVVVQSRDAKSAQALQEWVADRVASGRERFTGGSISPDAQAFADTMIRVLTPRLQTPTLDRLAIHCEGQDAKLFLVVVGPRILGIRAQERVLKAIRDASEKRTSQPLGK